MCQYLTHPLCNEIDKERINSSMVVVSIEIMCRVLFMYSAIYSFLRLWTNNFTATGDEVYRHW